MAAFLFNFDTSAGEELQAKEESKSLHDAPIRPCPMETVVGELHKTIATLASSLQWTIPGSTLQLQYLTSECVMPVLSSSDVEQSQKTLRDFKALLDKSADTDLIPSVYEGGLVLWEGAIDLVSYLAEIDFDFAGLDVLELGCGSGLPSIYALIKGAKSVSLQDYNYEVINFITIPSVLLNVEQKKTSNCRFYSASWEDLDKLVADPANYDVILTSETIYSECSQHTLLSAIKSLLKPSGQVFLAAKSYYFGVGGSSSNFEQLVRADGLLSCERCKSIDCAVPRVVMCLKR